MPRTLLAFGVALAVLPAEAHKPKAKKPIELLHNSDSSLAVSSTVLNKRDQPEHIADGKPDTAWSSRTGDLVGAWIAIRLPETARVSDIRLTVGYTHKQGVDDWFVMNPRIRQVKVSHDGKDVGTFDLDPKKRTLQKLPATGGGGEWRIEVTALEPGTRARWREVCVSELEVWGTVPDDAVLPAPRDPDVVVGESPTLGGTACSDSGSVDGRFHDPKRVETVSLRVCSQKEESHGAGEEPMFHTYHRSADLVFAVGRAVVDTTSIGSWDDGGEFRVDTGLVGALPLGDGTDAVVVAQRSSGPTDASERLLVIGPKGVLVEKTAGEIKSEISGKELRLTLGDYGPEGTEGPIKSERTIVLVGKGGGVEERKQPILMKNGNVSVVVRPPDGRHSSRAVSVSVWLPLERPE
jgi:hypothetical protein